MDAYNGVYRSKPSAKQGSLPMKNLKTIIILLHCLNSGVKTPIAGVKNYVCTITTNSCFKKVV